VTEEQPVKVKEGVHDAHDDPILVINVMFAFVCEVIDIT
jgi:hypothetical protein